MPIRNKLGQFTPRGNLYVKCGDVIECYGVDGEMLFFTDADLEDFVVSRSWCKAADGYAATRVNGLMVTAHRLISNPKDTELVDHINRNKKDNRRCNLRNTNKSENAFNSRKRVTNTSGRPGVSYRNDTHKWHAEIKYNGKKYSLGDYKTFEDAVKAREDGEIRFYGYKWETKGQAW